mgnify:CR=1 FL=1
MSNTAAKAKKSAILTKFGRSENDTGSPESQVSLLTHRINDLTGHFKTHAKDFAGKKGLLKMIGQRRRLLNYLRATDHQRYNSLIQGLELRK